MTRLGVTCFILGREAARVREAMVELSEEISVVVLPMSTILQDRRFESWSSFSDWAVGLISPIRGVIMSFWLDEGIESVVAMRLDRSAMVGGGELGNSN